ncbi:major facilitator superfamily domain-containing protein [Mucidula mucida]|nr:major facilitator superfamily domain-containing protein [Mucidula mucida]
MTSSDGTEVASRTPLATYQLFVVFLVQLAEPITATVIYPFAPEFVRRTGITGGDETKTGYYAGLIESAFFIAESLSVFHWGRAADKFGRRPVLLLGPLGLALSMLGFGLSNNFWFLVLFRCLQGVFNGNIGVAKTIMAELTDSTNIGDVFAILPLVWCFGATSGPIIGGLLSNPQDRWPVFNRLPVFRDHPYFLPCSVAGAFAFVIFILTLSSLKETHPTLTGQKKDAASDRLLADTSDSEYGATVDSGERRVTPPSRVPSLWDIANKNVVRVVAAYCFMNFCQGSYEVLTPLMYSTSIPIGGLGLSPYEIGWIMFAWGVVNALLQFFLTSTLIRTLGARRTFITSMSFLSLSFFAFSFESYFARRAGYIDWRVMTLMVIHMSCNLFISSAYGAGHVLVVQSATNRETLGSTNGLAQMFNSGMRGFAPSIASSLFSVTLQKNLAGGFMVYIVFWILMSIGVKLSMRIPKFMTVAS